MAKLPWYLKTNGEPYVENDKVIQDIKVHWIFILYMECRFLFNKCIGK
jgi:hypothetical protein